jgi:hypothetical protein
MRKTKLNENDACIWISRQGHYRSSHTFKKISAEMKKKFKLKI